VNPRHDTANPDPHPVRYDGVTMAGMANCAWCGVAFAASGRRRFHSDACRQANYRARQATVAEAPGPTAPRPDATVYQCPSCDQRYLGIRRCDDCNLFCRRVGPGGLCPNCDEPVAESDLRA
jgi:hypothetical protein